MGEYNFFNPFTYILVLPQNARNSGEMEIQQSVCLIVWWVKKQSHRLVIFYNFDWLIIDIDL